MAQVQARRMSALETEVLLDRALSALERSRPLLDQTRPPIQPFAALPPGRDAARLGRFQMIFARPTNAGNVEPPRLL